MIDIDPFIDDKLISIEREYKKVLNKVFLIFIFWLLLLSFIFFVGSSNEDVKNIIYIFGALSLVPFIFYESFILLRLMKVKKERKNLKHQKTLYEDYSEGN